jgi:hypothetical protein
VSVVKTRLHRARAMLRRRHAELARAACRRVFELKGERCDRVVATVLARIAPPPLGSAARRAPAPPTDRRAPRE